MAPLEVFDGTEALCLPLSLFLLRHLNLCFQTCSSLGSVSRQTGEERSGPSHRRAYQEKALPQF